MKVRIESGIITVTDLEVFDQQTVAELLTLTSELEDGFTFPLRLVDFRETTVCEVDFDSLFKTSLKRSHALPTGRTAMLYSSQAVLGNINMWINLMADSSVEIRAFKQYTVALDWLYEGSSHQEHGRDL